MGYIMKNVLDTLFLPFQQDRLSAAALAVGFWGAQFHPALRDLGAADFYLQQYFKPYAAAL